MNLIQRMFIAAHTKLYHASGGRFGAGMMGQKVLLLTTTGNKSGKERTVPVMRFDDGDRRFVIASAAGSDTHPAWYKNLVKNPEVTVEVPGERYKARAETLSGDERKRVYALAASRMPRFNDYEQKAGGREIPVVELKRA
jgi:deazaflavin-dependent oxidoreductase (nitroreductase family)